MSFEEIGYRLEYMEWAKTVMEASLPGVIDVGSSGIAAVRLRELGVRLSDLELAGPHYYGEPELRRRIARLAGTRKDRVLPTLGASHAHFLICASLLRAGDEVIVETPGYEALSALPRALGARVVPLPRRFEDGFQFDPTELRRRLTPRTRLVLVTNLHNPSGVALAPEGLAALAECAGGESPASPDRPGPRRRGGRPRAGDASAVSASAAGASAAGVAVAGPRASAAGVAGPEAKRASAADMAGAAMDASAAGASAIEDGIWVVVNEVYRDFVFRDPPVPGHRLGPRGVSLGSLTKVYGLGETRVGWAIGDAALLHRASRVNDFGVVNSPYIAERIGALALSRRARLLTRTRAIIRRNRPILDAFISQTPSLELVPPAGGLITFPRLRGVRDTQAFAARALRERGVCVVPGEFFGAPGHLRIGIGSRDPRLLREGLRRLAAAIRDADGR